jgi:hypothetical protein
VTILRPLSVSSRRWVPVRRNSLKPTIQLPQKTKKALYALGHQQSAYRRCGLSACKIIFFRKPVRGAYKRLEDYRMRGGFYCVFCGNWFVGLSLFLWLRLYRAA